jgi:hypothetical protein
LYKKNWFIPSYCTVDNAQRKCADYCPHLLNLKYQRDDSAENVENGVGVI